MTELGVDAAGLAALGPRATPPGPAAGTPGFASVLTQQGGGLRFSAHAAERLRRRGIDAGPAALARLQGAVERAAAKGAREAVVLLDGAAYVVAVRSRTVITALDRSAMRDQVVTNIDSAVIA